MEKPGWVNSWTALFCLRESQGDLASRLIVMGVTGVTIWLLGVISMLSKYSKYPLKIDQITVLECWTGWSLGCKKSQALHVMFNTAPKGP